MIWRRLSALFAPRNSSRSEYRLFAAYNRFRKGEASGEDAELIIADLASFTGFYRVHPPDDALAFQEGKRAAFGRLFYFLNLTEAEARLLAEAARAETLADQTEGIDL
jgi:hypothetical protein